MQQPPLQPLPRNRKRPPGKARALLIKLLIVGVILGTALAIGGGVALAIMAAKLPKVEELEKRAQRTQSTEIYTESGQFLTRISPSERSDEDLRLNDLPKYLPDAVISAEDRRFWDHEGVDLLGLARIVIVNIRHPERMQGGSTLTQQLVKNLFLTPERTAGRKVAEAVLAVQLDMKYSKQRILELYLNRIFWGHNVYGIEAAAQVYFGKSARYLTLAESALLAGIIRGPEYYSPYHNPDAANKLKEIVLDQMEKDRRITPEEKAEALKQQIRLVGLRTSYPYPYFLDYVLYNLRKDYGDAFRRGGLKVYTTLNPRMQAYAERLLLQQSARLSRSRAQQAALVSLDPQTGAIRAMVGGINYATSQFNRAFQAQRQVGSTFKPFVYLTAFENGKSLQSTVEDAPINMGGWRPRNWDHRFRGKVSLQQSLAMSLNIPTVKTANEVGMNKVIQTARRAGVTSPIAPDLTSALGSSEMTLLEITAAYGAFANGGYAVTPKAITKVVDHQGFVLYEAIANPTRVFGEAPISQLNAGLQAVISSGTGTMAQIGRPAAGKTGTTDNAYDAWFVGYVPQLVTGVWAGNDNPSVTRGGGGSLCGPIWRAYMREAVQGLPIEGFGPLKAIETSPEPSASASTEATPEPTATNSIVEIPLESTAPPEASPSALPSFVPPQEPVASNPAVPEMPEVPEATPAAEEPEVLELLPPP
jgi:penicillin-binding protein 1A